MLSISTKQPGKLPPGVYWVGDLSYVIKDFFDQGIDELEGVNLTKDGYPFAVYHTMYGDGVFDDSDGDAYAVDVANIGCIPIDAIEELSDLGHIVRFHIPFVCCWIAEGGFICFGDLAIKTDPLSDAEFPGALEQQQISSGRYSFEFESESDVSPCFRRTYIKIDPYALT